MDAEVHQTEFVFTRLKFTGQFVPMMMLPGRSTSNFPLGASGSGRSA